MTARRVLITQERIIQTDDTNEFKCGERCQFLRTMTRFCESCRLDGAWVSVIDRNRTEACTDGEVRAWRGPGAGRQVAMPTTYKTNTRRGQSLVGRQFGIFEVASHVGAFVLWVLVK